MKEQFKDREKIHIALIATYPDMTRMLMSMARAEGIEVDNYYASFDEAVKIAIRIEDQVDAIMTRGGTGKEIKDNVSIPVIQIPITPFDLYCSVKKLDKNVKELAFINFNRTLYGVEEIEEEFNIKIHQLTFQNNIDIEKNVDEMKARHVTTIIGGNVAAEYAKQRGMNGIEITTGEETVYRALQEAIAIVRTKKEEQKKTQRLSVAFNSISEGIIISDEDQEITICNTAARQIFEFDEDSSASRGVVRGFLKDTDIGRVYDTKKAEINRLFKVNDLTTNVSHIPIRLGEDFIGAVSTIADITRIQQLEGQIRNQLNERGFYAKYNFKDILTQNPNMNNCKEMARLYAMTQSTILIEGESGVGKELFAQSIHNASKCAKGPFVAINCAAIPEQLLESELFGYEGGAFTGAKKDGKKGLFEMANNGTIFLDEIGEIEKTLQARLLRTLQEKEIMRVGGNKVIPVNVRVIGATNKNLREKVREGIFREDLYYRLNVLNVKIPPLRERKEDIPILCDYYIRSYHSDYGERKAYFEEVILPRLMQYDWPGNIRELGNVMERLDFFLKGKIEPDKWTEMVPEIQVSMAVTKGNVFNAEVSLEDDLKTSVNKVEKEIIRHMMEETGNDQEMVAARLGIGKTTLWRKMTGKE